MSFTEQNSGASLPRIPAPGGGRGGKEKIINITTIRAKKKQQDRDREREKIRTRLIIRQKLKQQFLYAPDLPEKEKFIEYSVIRGPGQ